MSANPPVCSMDETGTAIDDTQSTQVTTTVHNMDFIYGMPDWERKKAGKAWKAERVKGEDVVLLSECTAAAGRLLLPLIGYKRGNLSLRWSMMTQRHDQGGWPTPSTGLVDGQSRMDRWYASLPLANGFLRPIWTLRICSGWSAYGWGSG